MKLPKLLRIRKRQANKGDFGHVFIIAGSSRYSGAAVLCAAAALRSGAGLVTLGIPQSLNNALIKVKPPEIMTLPLPDRGGYFSPAAFGKISKFAEKTDIVVIGPGLSTGPQASALARKVIARVNKPMLVDADGLNALAGHLNKSILLNKIITPHPGEMARLADSSAQRIQADRKGVAKRFSKYYNVTIVLKGYRTIVASPAGKVYVNTTGNPGMATAGSGDVLSGVIAAFWGQGLSAFEASKYGTYIHGLAGDLAARDKTEISLIASDITGKIPEAVRRCS